MRLPVRVAAAIAGLSEPTFRKRVLPRVELTDGRVTLAGLEHVLGRGIDGNEYLAAQLRLAGRRAREAKYKRA